MSTHLERMPFSASVFQLVQFASLTNFIDWQASPLERLARCLLPPAPTDIALQRLPEFADLHASCSKWTMLDVFRAAMVLQLLERSLDKPGDVIECGAGPGGISLMMARLIQARKIPKKVFVYDSFEGLPAPDRSVDRAYRAGACAYSFEGVQKLMREHGVDSIVELRKGWLSETLPQLPTAQTFCFAHIDVDLYSSAQEAIAHLYDRVDDAGALVFDDYYDGSGGVFKAVNEAAHRLRETVHIGPTCQAYFLKGKASTATRTIRGTDAGGRELRVKAAVGTLEELPEYFEFLKKTRDALTPVRCRLLSALERRLLPDPLVAARDSIDAYLQMCTEPAVDSQARYPLEPMGEVIHASSA